jgi:hypothetical protein
VVFTSFSIESMTCSLFILLKTSHRISYTAYHCAWTLLHELFCATPKQRLRSGAKVNCLYFFYSKLAVECNFEAFVADRSCLKPHINRKTSQKGKP